MKPGPCHLDSRCWYCPALPTLCPGGYIPAQMLLTLTAHCLRSRLILKGKPRGGEIEATEQAIVAGVEGQAAEGGFGG